MKIDWLIDWLIDLVITVVRLIVTCFASLAVVFGGIAMGGAFAVKYAGIIMIQVRYCCKILISLRNRTITGESLSANLS